MAQRSIYPWTTLLAELQSQPNRWRLFPTMSARPASVIRRINRRGVRALRAPGGQVQAKPGWIGTTTDGRTIADVYLRWRQEGD